MERKLREKYLKQFIPFFLFILFILLISFNHFENKYCWENQGKKKNGKILFDDPLSDPRDLFNSQSYQEDAKVDWVDD